MNTDTRTANKILDGRTMPCSVKHALILKTWRELSPGDYFILVNDHDPAPLRNQFEVEFPGTFTWDYLERGPEGVRIKLRKLKAIAADQISAPGSAYGCSSHA